MKRGETLPRPYSNHHRSVIGLFLNTSTTGQGNFWSRRDENTSAAGQRVSDEIDGPARHVPTSQLLIGAHNMAASMHVIRKKALAEIEDYIYA